MSIKTRIKDLLDERHQTFAELERKVGIGNGTISRWDISSPKSDTLQQVADYFGVSVDYLLGRTDDRKISKADMIHNVPIDEALGTIMSYDGKPVSEHDKVVMKDLLEAYLRSRGE